MIALRCGKMEFGKDIYEKISPINKKENAL